ncbi:TetR/AcrR family transcriptional regulator [Ramlibacter tataouinensis]|uniref:Transcriptional regulator, TetR family-like protein n=1 Tax=Ramlibacter tataouinensis (strain ATCC BAA-407 / DSM 14655 / LMG 21543 / TTB310) TaxID=365046 RepID=F5XVQ0_RAMTT|nr:TetR/AcrR family transcriptional regulator [Ramlibacter tataouinensis]AEG92813.1 transcriptional regulator, TetR family-like protein [Ramlibacter tataouinensis TTB310]
MGRQKTFSDDEVLEGVADVFAANGFKGTSVQMLADACGLGKQSLYNSFGDKQNLYLKALDCSAARYASVVNEMDRAPDGRSAIRLFFERVLGSCVSQDPAEQACIVSAGLLEGVADPRISEALRGKWAYSHDVLRTAVRRGQADGSIASADDPGELADVLMALMGGLRINARAVEDPKRLQKTLARVLSVLDTAPAPSRKKQPR